MVECKQKWNIYVLLICHLKIISYKCCLFRCLCFSGCFHLVIKSLKILLFKVLIEIIVIFILFSGLALVLSKAQILFSCFLIKQLAMQTKWRCDFIGSHQPVFNLAYSSISIKTVFFNFKFSIKISRTPAILCMSVNVHSKILN